MNVESEKHMRQEKVERGECPLILHLTDSRKTEVPGRRRVIHGNRYARWAKFPVLLFSDGDCRALGRHC
jgi:hypothetical protein